MKTAQEIRAKCDADIKELQESCVHEETEWMEDHLMPGHSVGSVRVCICCEKAIERSPGGQDYFEKRLDQ